MSLENQIEHSAHAENEAKTTASESARAALAADAAPAKSACSAILSDANQFNTLDKLAHASKQELDCLYNSSTAGKVPEGDTKGVPLFMPQTYVGEFVNYVGSHVWHGKEFDHGDLTNKIFNTHLFNAKVEQGQSWTDSNTAVVIDYQKGQKAASDHLTSWIRDEIREIRPGIYLGQLHNQGLPFLSKNANITYFALDANKK